ncbi:MAG: Sua5/YciO/YrdC/YwlC family protein, partial [Hyphomicrobiales bacterium]|nr:Sua5/YciO/YrdC/YwlC family protein [Hyphomicrobiales bacterium]
VTRAQIESALGRPVDAQAEAHADAAAPALAPGMLASHYAPRAPVRLEATHVGAGEAALDFAGQLPGGEPRLDLSPTGDLREAAARLFAALRALDAPGITAIAVAPIPHEGLGEAINDRLARAAAPR